MLLREFWTNRFWPYCTRNLRESTRVGYESAWRLHVRPVFGASDMDAISWENFTVSVVSFFLLGMP